jgi:hypothetical protein
VVEWDSSIEFARLDEVLDELLDHPVRVLEKDNLVFSRHKNSFQLSSVNSFRLNPPFS